ncbi:MAG: ComEC/Rec2 family competence protein, partial [Bryobacteraceae bacterium]
NVVVVPLMSLVVPIGFLAIFTGWGPVAWLTGWLLSMTRVIVEWHAAWEPWWRIPDPPFWLAASFTLSLILLGLANRSHQRWRWLAGIAVSLLLLVLIVHPFPPRVNAGELEVTSIDVGQGDSAFLSLPAGKLMVLDGGGAPGFGKRSGGLDPGEEVVSPYLWSRSVRRLDVVALSHAHEDHIGGLNAIVKNFKPAELWMGPAPDTPSWRQLRDTAQRQGIRIRRLCAGERFTYGGAIVEVLAPSEDSSPSTSPKDLDSMVFRVSFGNRSFLLTGDLDDRVEYDLVEAGAIRPADVLKVAHHGSRRSTSEEFLAAVHPAFAIISVGADNTYGHPHPELLRRLNDARATTLRTDEWGFVSFVTDGRRLGLTTWRSLGPQRGPLQPF